MRLELPKGLTDSEAEERNVNRFRELRNKIFETVPEDCYLKPKNSLELGLVLFIDTEMIQRGIVVGEDICSLCSEALCPHNDMEEKDRKQRLLKIGLLNRKDKLQ